MRANRLQGKRATEARYGKTLRFKFKDLKPFKFKELEESRYYELNVIL